MYSVPSWPDTVTLFESQMSACTFLVSVRRVICYLDMVTLSGNYPSRCTWRRKPYAHDINRWVMPDPGVDVFQESASFSLAHILVASPNRKELLSCVLHVKTVSCRKKEICHNLCLHCLQGADSEEHYPSFCVQVFWLGDLLASHHTAV